MNNSSGGDPPDALMAAALNESEKLVLAEEKERALQEAKECLEIIQAEHFILDGFNLLGVVANPRHGMLNPSSMHASSRHAALTTTTTDETNAATSHGSNTNSNTSHGNGNGNGNGAPPTPSGTPATNTTTTADASYFTEAAHSIEYTLQQVTEQIENLNLFLEELSRHYLGDDDGGESLFLEYYYQNRQEEPPPPVPTELANLQLTTLQLYLEECGVLAHTFSTTVTNTNTNNNDPRERPHGGDATTMMTTTTTTTNLKSKDSSLEDDEDDSSQDLSQLPPVFANPDFDLTDPTTFVQLLVGSESSTSTPPPASSTTPASTTTLTSTVTKSKPNSLYQPTSELVPLIHQDAFASSLDQVELALQDQVRQKAGVFFQETVRFRQLQVAIVALLEQVQQLRTFYKQLQQSYVHDVAEIDACDYQRRQLERLDTVLEAAKDLILCKSSISGLVSANNHPLGAAEQIHYGRQLLKGETTNHHNINHHNDNSNGTTTNTTTNTNADKERIELQQLVALHTCEDQFTQYETLVVQNLSEELVELFLNWKPANTTNNNNNGSGSGGEIMVVQDMVQALVLCQALPTTGQLYIRRLQQLIRMTVRTTIAEFVEQQQGGVTGMTQLAFSNCLEMLLEELLTILQLARTVDEFCVAQEIFTKESSSTTTTSLPSISSSSISMSSSSSSSPPKPPKDRTQTPPRWTWEAVTSAADLALKSIAELLRLRKEAHSLLKLDDMKELWDTCLNFTLKVEGISDSRAVGLRSTLVGQAKAFWDRTHESNMSALMAALDLERWTQCEISSERQLVLTRLCTGRAILPHPPRHRTQDGSQEQNNGSSATEKTPTAEVEGVNYKVVWSCLLLVEMIMTNLSAAAHFRSLAANAVGKIAELLRVFNTRATQLVLGAGAINSAARLKSINAKHLSLVTQCLGMMLALLPHIRAALMAQLPPKQHTLLTDIDKIKKDYVDHNENVLNKFVTIIGGIVEHGLAPRIANTNFDARARDLPFDTLENLSCCVFLEGVSSNTRKMHQVLNALLPPDHLQDVFSRIFAYVDQKLPALLIAATNPTSNGPSSFKFPETVEGKRRFLLEVECMTQNLNRMNGVHPWDFTAIQVLERKLDYELEPEKTEAPQEEETPADEELPAAQNESPPDPEEGSPTSEEPPAVNGEEGAESVEAEEPAPEENGEEPAAEKEDETTAMGNGSAQAENGSKEDAPAEEANVEATANSE